MKQEKTPFGEGATKEKRFNTPILDEFQGIESIYEYESPQCKERLKMLAILAAVSEIAKTNNLSLKQKVEIYSPTHWNNSPGQNLDKEFEAFKRCGSQGFISITEKFDSELANKSWYTNHLTFRNKQIFIDAEHIGFKSNQGYKKPFIKPPIYIDSSVTKKSITKKDIRKKQMEKNYD